jgi:hypothetical protein
MAAGSHLENGVWALLVIAARRIDKMIIQSRPVLHILRANQLLAVRVTAIAIKINASPKRFVTAVIMPAPRDLGFW